MSVVQRFFINKSQGGCGARSSNFMGSGYTGQEIGRREFARAEHRARLKLFQHILQKGKSGEYGRVFELGFVDQ